MTAAQMVNDVRVTVTGTNRLFEDILVAALQRRGIAAERVAGEAPDVLIADERSIAAERTGHAPCVLLVERDDPATRRFARLVGARACVPRAATPDHLAATVLRVARGDDLLSAGRTALEHLFLTSRENDVLQLMAAGHDNATIAQHLEISPHTARTHVQRILTKFDVRSRFSAVSVARGRGLLRSTS